MTKTNIALAGAAALAVSSLIAALPATAQQRMAQHRMAQNLHMVEPVAPIAAQAAFQPITTLIGVGY
jgi:hypothetical protein